MNIHLSHTHTHTHTLSLSLSHTHTHTLIYCPWRVHARSLCLPPPPPLFPLFSDALTHARTHTHTHTHTHKDQAKGSGAEAVQVCEVSQSPAPRRTSKSEGAPGAWLRLLRRRLLPVEMRRCCVCCALLCVSLGMLHHKHALLWPSKAHRKHAPWLRVRRSAVCWILFVCAITPPSLGLYGIML